MRVLLISVLVLLEVVVGLKQNLLFSNEKRHQFFIERFGAVFGSRLAVTLQLLTPNVERLTHNPNQQRMMVVLKHQSQFQSSELKALQLGNFDARLCLASDTFLLPPQQLIKFHDRKTWNIELTVTAPMKEGFYYLYFAHCVQPKDFLPLSFEVQTNFVNPGPNYLSYGYSAVPSVYCSMSFLFFVAFIWWIVYLRKHAQETHHVHNIMTSLIVLKIISLFADGMRFSYMKHYGDTLTSWNVVFYVFFFLKGIMWFVVVLLIGTGWSLVKPILNAREKNLILVVLILQVLNNIAVLVVAETSIGSQAWVKWRDILHFVDIICCGIVFFPIASSIKKLRQAAKVDGKGHVNLEKLKTFKSFYLIVICYIYFTRIILYLLVANLPFNLTWMRVLFAEGAALCFYSLIGYKFRPQAQSPYLPVAVSDDLDEFGLEEDEIEMTDIKPSK